MDSFPLGGFSVTRIGFGAMQLPGPGVFGPPRDRDAALAVLRRAVELGVDHIDTAQFYGPNVANELIREALHPYPDNLALVSKVGGRRDDAGAWLSVDGPDDLRRDLEANLSTLGVDRLAAVNLRLFESDGPDQHFDDQLSVMIAARDEGLIDGIGLSEITREHLLHALERTEIACVQNAFNLVHRASAPVLQECTARGIAFVPFFPLGSAFAESNPVLGNELIQQAATRLACTPAQIALAWTQSVAPNVLLIPGTSSVQHLEENLAVAEIELDDETREQLNAVAG
jgi:aryl-alcohol dehydrogenase-like predicted oxidoreductase